jgi:DNA-binding NtrC family response regulator
VANSSVRVLLLCKDLGTGAAIGRALGREFETRINDDFQTEKWNESQEWCDVVLLDMLQSGNGEAPAFSIDTIQQIRKSSSRVPVIALCNEEDTAFVSQVIEQGAYDTVSNPPNMAELRLVLRRASKARRSEDELDRLRTMAVSNGRLHELLGTSPAMMEVFSLARKIAPCDVNVMITGETGTGKELLARAIHRLSLRASRPLVAFSCANLPETLIEDELFGHEKGAFTGALMNRRGRMESADQGTLFLDEIGDLGIGLQPKLLRVLQERSFERLGSNTPISVNLRLISASNRNLTEMVQRGSFREDLYYRLNVVQLHLPALRERREDIPLLAAHFLQASAQQFNRKAKRFSQPALRVLEEYGWPGNVRELENVVQRAVVLADGHTVDLWHLPAGIRPVGDVSPLTRSYEDEVRNFKKRLILRTLQECGWRKAESARALGMARGYLHRLINQLDIRQNEDASASVNGNGNGNGHYPEVENAVPQFQHAAAYKQIA